MSLMQSHFFCATSSKPTAMIGSNGYGFWKPSE
jgi:hypothetical protein